MASNYLNAFRFALHIIHLFYFENGRNRNNVFSYNAT